MKKKDKYNISESEDYMSTASVNDCTGLIPANDTDLEALEAYSDIYAFGVPKLDESIEKPGITAVGKYEEVKRPLQ